jgi:hypothetical protein
MNMRVPANQRKPTLRAADPTRFLVISIHQFKAEGVSDKYVLFSWEYNQVDLQPEEVTPVLRRRELDSAQKFCREHGLIPMPTNEKDPLNTVEYWVQPDATSIIESWT